MWSIKPTYSTTLRSKKITSVTTNLNKGYEDGFHNNEPKKPDNDDYLFGYDIGKVDGTLRKRHLQEKRKTDRRLDMKDWLSDKADCRNLDS